MVGSSIGNTTQMASSPVGLPPNTESTLSFDKATQNDSTGGAAKMNGTVGFDKALFNGPGLGLLAQSNGLDE